MDWDWKEFAWDASELDPSHKNSNSEEASSVDLRLAGEASDLEKKEEESSIRTVSSSSSSAKRSRLQNGPQNLSCLVDGCSFDLSDCREYHRRHRVCEKHSKTPVVLVGGKQQRFCQQCSRFHSLGEFDEVKRSCRKRLDGHNRRRRKPQPPSFLMSSEKFMYNYKGPRILHFGNPQPYANPIVRNMWPAASISGAKAEYDHHRFLYRIDKHRQDKELLLWQDNVPKSFNESTAMPGTPIHQPICGSTIAPSTTAKLGLKKPLPSDGKPGCFDAGCALYLLSTIQTQTQSPSSGTEQFDAAVDKPGSHQVLVLDANTTNLHCNGMLQMGHDGLVENGDSLALPFFWE
ncbi:hypothetical protein HN51_016648 [Arachis hypogaea]|uniref:Squamosa promoter-binding-like protein 18 n=2 Tax=Arachis TaxID=3817 RepID=A0A6P5M6K9_ARADU|nr:squamosa promoter-binding-like protein 18 [Arachis duranensis]XP_020980782.1 squamosa promoter-binding-like protein 18 [Arachis duranensis]XP_025606035.1 squamosa promoter-binding-like protein 18 [Arachis hypogaea]XP_025606036.1 squamosa promoter-binding-like protein 18 [Arachis hypogaea]QHO47260.1 Teosinte glume architecture [Arachis hypogaea]RYR54409.1 hypothetical protein Ahy_A06g029680 isoform A [Arachis hypogaea]RYR54410.1 hypothetical protein Ahy_A06g029680 isoform B [Arachis hypogae